MQIVNFHESNSNSIVYAAYDRGVIACWQICNDRRLPWVTRCVATVLDFLHLVMGDNPADYRSLPVIIAADQSAAAIVQFQCRISQRTGNFIWRRTKLRTNGANNHPFGGRTLHDKTTNHHVVSRLNRDASGNVAELCTVCCSVEPVHLIGIRRVGATSCSPAAPTSADAEAATRILPGGSVIRCDRAIAPAPFALSAKGNVGLDLNPVGAGAEHSRTRQVYGERTAVLLDWLMSRAVDLRH